MTCPQMLAHVNAGLRMAIGDLAVEPKRLPFRYPPLKQLAICVLPIPKGVPTVPELLHRIDGAAWEEEVAGFRGLIQRFVERSGERSWPDHPAFGRMSRRAWGVQQFGHIHHHFQQFEV